MKLMMLIGGILGFAIGAIFSLLQGSSWPHVVWHACLAAYLAGLMLRWWGRLWVRNLQLAFAEKQAAASRADHPITTPKR